MPEPRAAPDPEDYSGVVLFLAVHELWHDMLNTHQPDHHGRCRVCNSEAWAGPWPCLLNLIAREAHALSVRWAEGGIPEQRGTDGRHADRSADAVVASPPESSGDQGGPGGGGTTDH